MDNRQVLLSLIRQNYKKISGIVSDESSPDKIGKNEKIVNSAINYNFFAGSNVEYVKDYRLLLDEKSLFKFFVMQNEILNKMFRYKELDFKYFLKDCKDLVDNYKYEIINKKYISGNFEYEKLVNVSPIFDYEINGDKRIKELTKKEYDSITEKEKIQVLYDLTSSLYARNKNINVSFENFVKDINYGEYNEKMTEKVSAKNMQEDNQSIRKLEPETNTAEKKKSKRKQESVIKNENGYYYGEDSKQGYLFVEENDIEK